MRTTRKCLIRAITDLVEKRSLQIDFADGTNGLFPYVWLRDCSLDSKTYAIGSAMKGRLHFMRDFDVNIRPLHLNLNKNDNCVLIQWPGDVLSRYEQSWLKTRCPGNAHVRENRREIYLGAERVRLWMRPQIEQRLRRFTQSEFFKDDKTLHDFLMAVCVDGIAILKGKPSDGAVKPEDSRNMLARIAQRIGILQRNHFGDIYEVCPKPDASNMAYANTNELPYHTDFPSLQNPPQLQMLYAHNRSECGGGLSMFVDGFELAQQMARRHPENFQLLCSLPLEFIEQGYDVHTLMDGSQERFDYHMVARHPTFKLDNNGYRVVCVQFGNVMRSWFIDHPDPLLVQKLYDALKLFTELCYEPDNQLIFPLENGDTVLWANTRLLHARSGYQLVGVPSRERHMFGCYFGWDIVKSSIRVIRARLGLPEDQATI